jgi:hypothetical protein
MTLATEKTMSVYTHLSRRDLLAGGAGTLAFATVAGFPPKPVSPTSFSFWRTILDSRM